MTSSYYQKSSVKRSVLSPLESLGTSFHRVFLSLILTLLSLMGMQGTFSKKSFLSPPVTSHSHQKPISNSQVPFANASSLTQTDKNDFAWEKLLLYGSLGTVSIVFVASYLTTQGDKLAQPTASSNTPPSPHPSPTLSEEITEVLLVARTPPVISHETSASPQVTSIVTAVADELPRESHPSSTCSEEITEVPPAMTKTSSVGFHTPSDLPEVAIEALLADSEGIHKEKKERLQYLLLVIPCLKERIDTLRGDLSNKYETPDSSSDAKILRMKEAYASHEYAIAQILYEELQSATSPWALPPTRDDGHDSLHKLLSDKKMIPQDAFIIVECYFREKYKDPVRSTLGGIDSVGDVPPIKRVDTKGFVGAVGLEGLISSMLFIKQGHRSRFDEIIRDIPAMPSTTSPAQKESSIPASTSMTEVTVG